METQRKREKIYIWGALRHQDEAIDIKLEVFLRTSILGRPMGGSGGSSGPHEGRFSKRMLQMKSMHRDELIDTIQGAHFGESRVEAHLGRALGATPGPMRVGSPKECFS